VAGSKWVVTSAPTFGHTGLTSAPQYPILSRELVYNNMLIIRYNCEVARKFLNQKFAMMQKGKFILFSSRLESLPIIDRKAESLASIQWNLEVFLA
jgi:hypothetical protein